MNEMLKLLDMMVIHMKDIVEVIWRAFVIFLLYNIGKHIEAQTDYLKGSNEVEEIGNNQN